MNHECKFMGGNYWLMTGGYSWEGVPYYSEFTKERALTIGWTEEELDALPVKTAEELF